jgi:ABC-2 type transport system ATP-binding protein
MVQDANQPAGKQIVVCQHLVKTFRDFWHRPRVRAVDDVSFTIEQGEIFGLLGPNGSGKSTCIKIILGLLHQTSGRVAVLGKLPSDVNIKKRIGYLPEESYLYQFLDARETLDYYGKLFELDRRTRLRRIDELLDMVGLTAVQHRQVREYSKGMQRRIGIAQALINDPELLILDEPTTGLDPIGSRQIRDLILSLGRRGKTVLLSSHMLADVEDCVDRMVILYGGKIRKEGTCDQLLSAEDRSIIETDVLDDATISHIDRVIREHTGGAKHINRVAKPRQKLEDLFVQIVETARAERIETAGAMHGGQTASFLRGGEKEPEAAGEQLISNLVSAGNEESLPAARDKESIPLATPPSREDDVLKQLLAKDEEALPPLNRPGEVSGAPVVPGSGVTKDVDLNVIGSLLDDDTDTTPQHPRKPERKP